MVVQAPSCGQHMSCGVFPQAGPALQACAHVGLVFCLCSVCSVLLVMFSSRVLIHLALGSLSQELWPPG